ncbi:hypothetical protein BH11MYX2_BH11MYX2_26540 [soil metagenome]
MSKWVMAAVISMFAISACVMKTSSNTPFGSSSSSNGAGPGTSGGDTESGGQSIPGADECSAVDRPKNADGVPLALACDRGFPIGAPMRGEGVAKDGTKTESGVSASWTCPGGNCKFFCKGGNCDAKCEGGNCQMKCIDMANCSLDCAGGNCKTDCLDTQPDGANAAGCSVDCPGGKCATKCDPAHTACSDTCSGGDGTTAQK